MIDKEDNRDILGTFQEDLRNITDTSIPAWLVDGAKNVTSKLISLRGWIERERTLLRRIEAWPKDPTRAAVGIRAKLLRERDDALCDVLDEIG